jgi:septal ring factor EnvC (AmiA/AmiB activator)
MHTDKTLHLLEKATEKLANELRSFIDNVCSKIQTEELAAEVEAREKREARRAEKKEIERQVRMTPTDTHPTYPC